MTDSEGPLLSDYADDPDLADLVELFVSELPARVEAIRTAFEAGDLGEVERLGHQLKGSAGGYGFLPITDSAGELEVAAQADGTADGPVRGAIAVLAQLCQRAADAYQE